MGNPAHLRVAGEMRSADDEHQELNLVFAALSDPVRREILDRLDGHDLLVSEIARHFSISLQAVSRHIQVLVRAGLVNQNRTGRISRCRLDVGPIYGAALWLNRYSKYWQTRFDLLALSLDEIARENSAMAGIPVDKRRNRLGNAAAGKPPKPRRKK